MAGKYKAYPEYQDSGVAWVGDAPAHWDTLRFKHALHEKRKALRPELPAGSISFGNVVFKNQDALSPETKASYQEVLAGEFLVNPLNLNYDVLSLRTALSTIDVVVSTGYMVLLNGTDLYPKFLRWLLHQFDVGHMKTLGAGVRQTVNFNDVGNSEFSKPSLPEQIQIARFLDHETGKIDLLIEKQQELIALLKEKRQAVISHAVTKGLNPQAPLKDSGIEWLGQIPGHWEVKRLKQSIQSGSSISYGIVQPGPPLDQGSPFIQTTNISKGDFRVQRLQKTTKQIEKLFPRSRLYGGEVILGIRASIGAAYVVEPHMAGFNLSRGIARIAPSKNIDANFLVWLLRSDVTQTYWGIVSQGTTFSEVSIGSVKELHITLPPLAEQKQISQSLKQRTTRFDLVIRKALSQTALLEERRTALISAAVTGKIDVRDWEPKPEETT